MSGGRLDRFRDADAGVIACVATNGFVTTCLIAAIALSIAVWRASPVFILVTSGLAGGSLGAFLSIVAEHRTDERRGQSAVTSHPTFHPWGAVVALGVAATILLLWGYVLEAVIPGYGAATTVGLLTYAILASTLPR